ncbi:MAG TPA: hypothetical protein ENK09_13050 [Nitrospirae bacterium]|nr:hypothetical protein [Nitrospirota bacterium]
MLNLPFGLLRSKCRKYSFKWFLYIHLPIPVVFLARVTSHLDYHYIPLFLIAAILGQLIGGRINI